MDDNQEKSPHKVWSGSFRVFDIDVRCHTLNDGRRIIEKDSFDALVAAMAAGAKADEDLDFARFTRWQAGMDDP